MTDNLVQRLRDLGIRSADLAADHIEVLTVRAEAAETRAEAAEAERDKAIELLIDALYGGKNNIIELMGGDNGRLDHGSKYNLIQAAVKAARFKSDAKSFGYHGPKNLREIIFQRHKVVISYDSAKQLCREYSGWKG